MIQKTSLQLYFDEQEDIALYLSDSQREYLLENEVLQLSEHVSIKEHAQDIVIEYYLNSHIINNISITE